MKINKVTNLRKSKDIYFVIKKDFHGNSRKGVTTTISIHKENLIDVSNGSYVATSKKTNKQN